MILYVSPNTLRKSTYYNISDTTIEDTAKRSVQQIKEYYEAQRQRGLTPEQKAAEAAAKEQAKINEEIQRDLNRQQIAIYNREIGTGRTIGEATTIAQQEAKARTIEEIRAPVIIRAVDPRFVSRAERFAPTGLGRTASKFLSGETGYRLEQLPALVQGQVIAAQSQSGDITLQRYIAATQAQAKKEAQESEQRLRTATKQAQSAAIKEAEIRAVAASQGVALGTIQKPVATPLGTVTPVSAVLEGKAKEVLIPSVGTAGEPAVLPSSSQLAKVDFTKLEKAAQITPTETIEIKPTGGFAITTKLAEELKISDEVKTKIGTPEGGEKFIRQLSDTVSIDEPFKISAPSEAPVRELTKEEIAAPKLFTVQVGSPEVGIQFKPQAQVEAISQNIIPLLTPASLATGEIIGIVPPEPAQKTKIVQEGLIQRFDLPAKPSLDQQLEQLTTNIGNLAEQRKKKGDEFGAGLAGFGEEFFSTVSFAINLQRKGGEYFERLFGGKPLPAKQLKEIQTVPAVAFGAPFSAVGAGVKFTPKGLDVNLGAIQQSLGESYTGITNLIAKQGLGRTLGQIAFNVVPYNRGAIPLKLARIPITTGVKTAEQIVKEGGIRFFGVQFGGKTVLKTVTTPITEGGATTLIFGFGGTKSIPLITKTTAGYSLGSPLKQLDNLGLEKLVTTGRGLELGTLRGFERKVFTSEPFLQKLVQTGKIRPEDISIIRNLEELSGLISKSPKSRQLKEILPPDIKTPIGSLRKGGEAKAFLNLLPTLPKSKGGFAQNLQTLTERYTEDLDVDFGGLFRGTQRAEKAAQLGLTTLQQAAALEASGREFSKVGTKVFVKEGQEEKKVLEFLTKKDINPIEELASPPQVKTSVFGQDITKGFTKITSPTGKGFKVITLQSQALRKIASVASIQSGFTEGAEIAPKAIPLLKSGKEITTTASGGRISPPNFRLKDVADLIGKGQIIETLAFLFKEKGKTKEYLRLLQINKNLRKLYPEVDFEKIATEAADPISFVKETRRSKELIKSGAQISPALVAQSSKALAVDFKASKELDRILESKINVSEIKSKPFDVSSGTAFQGKQLITSIAQTGSISKIAKEKDFLTKSIDNLSSIAAKPSGTKLAKDLERIVGLSRPSKLPESSKVSIGISSPNIISPATFSPISPESPLSKISIASPIEITSPISGISPPSPIKVGSPIFPPSPPRPPSPIFPLSPPSPPRLTPPRVSPPKFPPSIGSIVLSPPPKQTILLPPKFPPIIIRANLKGKKQRRLPTYKKALTFIADPADPLRAGVLEAAGVSQLVSGDARIFRTIDRNLAKARRKAGAFTPLGEYIR